MDRDLKVENFARYEVFKYDVNKLLRYPINPRNRRNYVKLVMLQPQQQQK